MKNTGNKLFEEIHLVNIKASHYLSQDSRFSLFILAVFLLTHVICHALGILAI